MRYEPARDRDYYPSPKKPRMDYNQGYQEPERRAFPKHLQRVPEPKPAPPVIEKRPVMFNDTTKNAYDYPPLPQRKPVQRPKVVPQPQPTKVIEKPPTIPVEKQVKPVQTQATKPPEKPPMKAVEKPPIKPVQKPPVSVQKPPVSVQKPPGSVQKSPVAVQKPSVSVQKPPGSVQKPPGSVQKPPVSVQKPPVSVQKPPVSVQKPPVSVQKPPVSVQKQPVKAVQNQPMKAVEQPQPMKTVQATQPVNPTQSTPVQKQPQPAPQTKQEVKPLNKFQAIKKEEPPLGPCPEGHSQLSEMMSRALGDELQAIMDAIVKELPKNLQTSEEHYVVRKIRTDIGEDIKKALGLNVTKRLLNIHNPLYVKLEFSGKPEPGCLQAFIKQYNISAFKRIAAPGDVFAARLDTIADLDCLCAGGLLSCGSAKVTVTPCYKYLVCPPKLHTIYGKYGPEKDKKPAENAVKTEEGGNSTDGEKNKETPTKGDKTIKPEVTDNDASDVSIKQEASDTNDDTDTEAKSTKTNSPIKINITIEAVPKTNDVKASNDEVSKEIDKTIKEEKDIKVEKDIQLQKDIKVEKDIKVKEEREAKDDSEEMNDSDIISLMSGGIVLDECHGSDDE